MMVDMHNTGVATSPLTVNVLDVLAGQRYSVVVSACPTFSQRLLEIFCTAHREPTN